MTFINQKWFDMPESRLLASGADLRSSRSEIVSPSGEVLARITNGGITAPRRVELSVATRIVRLAGGGLPQDAASGCWWLEWSQYKRVEVFADARGMSMPMAMRVLACVPLEWNEMTMVVQARLKLPLLAYAGASAPVVQKNPKFGVNELISGLDDVGARIEQLYIPGMTSPDLRHDAVMVEGYGHLPANLSRNGYIIRLQT